MLNLGVRYDRQGLTGRHDNVAPRLGFAWNPGNEPADHGARRLRHLLLARSAPTSSPAGSWTAPRASSTSARRRGSSASRPRSRRCRASRPGAVLPAARHHRAAGRAAPTTASSSTSRGCPATPTSCSTRAPSRPRSASSAKSPPAGSPSLDLVHADTEDIERNLDLNAPDRVRAHRPGADPPGGGGRRHAADHPGRQRLPPHPGDGEPGREQVRRRCSSTCARASPDAWRHAAELHLVAHPQQRRARRAGRRSERRQPARQGVGRQPARPAPPRRAQRLGARCRSASTSAASPPTPRAGRSTSPPAPTTTATARTADRPVIDGHVISRNAGRGDAVYDLSLFLERDFPLGVATLGLRAEAFNVTDHENVVGYNGVYGNNPTAKPWRRSARRSAASATSIRGASTSSRPACASRRMPDLLAVRGLAKSYGPRTRARRGRASPCGRARCSASSVRTARGRRRSSNAWPACSRADAGEVRGRDGRPLPPRRRSGDALLRSRRHRAVAGPARRPRPPLLPGSLGRAARARRGARRAPCALDPARRAGARPLEGGAQALPDRSRPPRAAPAADARRAVRRPRPAPDPGGDRRAPCARRRAAARSSCRSTSSPTPAAPATASCCSPAAGWRGRARSPTCGHGRGGAGSDRDAGVEEVFLALT